MFKTIYGKILCGIVAIAISFGAGYFVMPTKTETITKTETVTVAGETKIVTVAKPYEVIKIVTVIDATCQTALDTRDSELRGIKTKSWIPKLNNRTLAVNDTAKNDEITLIESLIASKEYLQQNPLATLQDKRILEDEIINLNKVKTNVINVNDSVALKCIDEINRYVKNGTAFSADVIVRLKALNLI